MRRWYRSGHPVHWLATRSQEMPRSIIVLYGVIFYTIYIYICMYIYIRMIIYIYYLYLHCVSSVCMWFSVCNIYIYIYKYIVYVQTIPAYGFCIYMILLYLYTHMFSHDINMKTCILFYLYIDVCWFGWQVVLKQLPLPFLLWLELRAPCPISVGEITSFLLSVSSSRWNTHCCWWSPL